MLLEQLLLLIAMFVAIYMIGIPLFKLVKSLVPASKKDPLVEAKIRLEIAQKEVEAAKLNKEADRLYQEIYPESLEEVLEEKDKRIEK